MSDELIPARELLRRLWELREALDRARVPEEVQRQLLLAITWEEAGDLLKTVWRHTHLNIRYLAHTSIGRHEITDHEEMTIPLQSLAGTGLPEQGKPWAEVFGITLVWLGK